MIVTVCIHCSWSQQEVISSSFTPANIFSLTSFLALTVLCRDILWEYENLWKLNVAIMTGEPYAQISRLSVFLYFTTSVQLKLKLWSFTWSVDHYCGRLGAGGGKLNYFLIFLLVILQKNVIPKTSFLGFLNLNKIQSCGPHFPLQIGPSGVHALPFFFSV